LYSIHSTAQPHHARGSAGEQRVVSNQGADASLEARTLHAASNHQAEHLERLSNLVLDIHQLALQRTAVCKQQLQFALVYNFC
jgi:hypothetical protein